MIIFLGHLIFVAVSLKVLNIGQALIFVSYFDR